MARKGVVVAGEECCHRGFTLNGRFQLRSRRAGRLPGNSRTTHRADAARRGARSCPGRRPDPGSAGIASHSCDDRQVDPPQFVQYRHRRGPR